MSLESLSRCSLESERREEGRQLEWKQRGARREHDDESDEPETFVDVHSSSRTSTFDELLNEIVSVAERAKEGKRSASIRKGERRDEVSGLTQFEPAQSTPPRQHRARRFP